MIPVFTLGLFSSVYGWGAEPHYVIAYIAGSLLSDDSVLFLQDILDLPPFENRSEFSEQLSDLAMWADEKHAAWAKYYHTAHSRPNFPVWQVDLDCGYRRVCLPTGIANWTSIASDPSSSRELRAESIMFLLHMMGDIHQPLHVGLWSDYGGLKIENVYPSYTPGWWGNMYNLHELWDRGLYLYWAEWHESTWTDSKGVERSAPVTWRTLASDLYTSIGPKFTKKYSTNLDDDANFLKMPSYIAGETSQICKRSAYRYEDGELVVSNITLSEAYMDSRTLVMHKQLKKAGLRLAQLLEQITAANYVQNDEIDHLGDQLAQKVSLISQR